MLVFAITCRCGERNRVCAQDAFSGNWTDDRGLPCVFLSGHNPPGIRPTVSFPCGACNIDIFLRLAVVQVEQADIAVDREIMSLPAIGARPTLRVVK